MDSKVDVSIIIPVYNIEKYIKTCLEHLVGDTSISFEVLIIDDGSLDGSNEIIREFIKNKNNFKIYEKTNGGLSYARNEGIKIAKGEYIFFIDGDDFIDIGSIEEIYRFAVINKLDIAIGNGKYYFENKPNNNKYFYPNKALRKVNVVTTGKYMFCYMLEHNCYKVEVWDKLYRREFLLNNELFFKEGLLQEDELFTPKAFYKAHRVKYFGNIAYNYRQRAGSITKTGSVKNCLNYIEIMEELSEIYRHNTENFKAALEQRLVQLYFRVLQATLNLTEEEKKIVEGKLKQFSFKFKFKFKFSFKIRKQLYEKNQALYKFFYIQYKNLRFTIAGKM